MSAELHLQGVGLHPAKPAGELAPGDTLVWNYGHASTVVSVTEASPAFVTVTERSHRNDLVYTRRLGKARLVGYGGESFQGHYAGTPGRFALEVGRAHSLVTFTPEGGRRSLLTSGPDDAVRRKYESYRAQHQRA